MILLPTSALRGGVEVNLGGDELVVRAGMALAAGLGEVGVIDGRARIGGGQNVVDAVTAGAVCDRVRADFRCHAVIAGEVRRNSAAGHAKFFRQSHAFVARRAGVLHIGCGDGRVRVLWSLDGVNAVTIGADRGLPVAAGNGRAVDALHVLLLDVIVTLGAGGRNVELVDRRLGIDGAQDVVLAVTVGANRGFLGTGCDRFAVDAFLIRSVGRSRHAAGRHRKLLAVAGAAGCRNVGVSHLRLGIAGRQDLVHAAVAVLTLGDVGVAGGRRLRMDTAIVGGLLIGVTVGALGHHRRGIVRESLDVGVAIGAAKDAMGGGFELGVVDVEADLLSVLVFRESRIAMAGQALVVGHLGRGFARLLSLGRQLRSCRCHHQQQGSKENQTTALHGAPASIRDSTHRRTFQDRRPKHMGAVSVLTSACDWGHMDLGSHNDG